MQEKKKAAYALEYDLKKKFKEFKEFKKFKKFFKFLFYSKIGTERKRYFGGDYEQCNYRSKGAYQAIYGP